MFGKIKDWLGIEGLKLELDIPNEISSDASKIDGSLILFTKRPQIVTGMTISLKERYTRGRKSGKLIDIYELGKVEHIDRIEINPDQIYEMPFSMPFDLLKSDVDKIGEWNFITRNLVSIAKKIKNAESEYWIEASADVEDTALNPLIKRFVVIR